MLFSSITFLFAFLPVVLLGNFALPRAARNAWLLAASLVFYAWGEWHYTFILLASIVFNWLAALLIERWRGTAGARATFVLGLVGNIALVATFKYANFIVDSVNTLAAAVGGDHRLKLAPVHLPLGISFFAFQALSYLIDVWRGGQPAERSLARVALFKSLFPQLIAGPIVRYSQVAAEIRSRRPGLADVAAGLRRFIYGLGKKVLIANTAAQVADVAFSLQPGELHSGVAWLGLFAYSLQIFFDFSGYSDMAIGLGQVLGFRFPENFRYPYAAGSVAEFWRRWHISLSTWFRDYLFLPLGGSRGSAARTYFNLSVVFLLCGLWHGASWNFVAWGAWHGAFLILERAWLGRVLARTFVTRLRPVAHIYTLGVVALGWVLFRAPSWPAALHYFSRLLGRGAHPTSAFMPMIDDVATGRFAVTMTIGALLSFPLAAVVQSLIDRTRAGAFVKTASLAWLAALFTASVASLTAGTHNPFIYFRF